MDEEQALWLKRGQALGSFLLGIGRLLKRLGGVSKSLDVTTTDTAAAQPSAGQMDSPEDPMVLGRSR